MLKIMFALLEHHEPANRPPTEGAPEGAGAVHWDLVVEVPGQERLATWRLSENPIGMGAAIAAERIADHRRIYLEYEGPLSGGRGWVRRVDGGDAQLCISGDIEGQVLLELHGHLLRGKFRLISAGLGLSFRRA